MLTSGGHVSVFSLFSPHLRSSLHWLLNRPQGFRPIKERPRRSSYDWRLHLLKDPRPLELLTPESCGFWTEWTVKEEYLPPSKSADGFEGESRTQHRSPRPPKTSLHLFRVLRYIFFLEMLLQHAVTAQYYAMTLAERKEWSCITIFSLGFAGINTGMLHHPQHYPWLFLKHVILQRLFNKGEMKMFD